MMSTVGKLFDIYMWMEFHQMWSRVGAGGGGGGGEFHHIWNLFIASHRKRFMLWLIYFYRKLKTMEFLFVVTRNGIYRWISATRVRVLLSNSYTFISYSVHPRHLSWQSCVTVKLFVSPHQVVVENFYVPLCPCLLLFKCHSTCNCIRYLQR